MGSKLVFDRNSSLGVLHFDELRFRNPGETAVEWRESEFFCFVYVQILVFLVQITGAISVRIVN